MWMGALSSKVRTGGFGDGEMPRLDSLAGASALRCERLGAAVGGRRCGCLTVSLDPECWEVAGS